MTMKRRRFLKYLSGIPFVGSLTFAKSSVRGMEPYEQPFLDKPGRIFNGQIFEAPYPLHHTVIAQWFDLDKWILLSQPLLAAHAYRAMVICRYKRKDGSYNPFYTQEELQEKLKDWKLIENKSATLEKRL